ncbi:MAG: hypothetical protein ACI9ZV_000856 [Candidatus Azotimanducaceae bacterium]|jgi:hypothetical protein
MLLFLIRFPLNFDLDLPTNRTNLHKSDSFLFLDIVELWRRRVSDVAQQRLVIDFFLSVKGFDGHLKGK